MYLYLHSGISNPDSVNPDSSLGDLGLDSLMGVEVKQTLERSFDICLSMKEIRQLTVGKLQKMALDSTEVKDQKSGLDEMSEENLTPVFDLMPTQTVVCLNDSGLGGMPLYIIHPIEGRA